MIIIINLDGEIEAQEESFNEKDEEKKTKFFPEAFDFPQPQLVPVSEI